MKNTFWKSIGAVVAGIFFIVVTHSLIDALLENVGILPRGHLHVGAGLILIVLAYRAIFSFAGCYLTAALAPAKPMKHSLILGIIGAVTSTVGAIVAQTMDLGPAWYGWTLVVMAVPIAWAAGLLFVARSTKVKRI